MAKAKTKSDPTTQAEAPTATPPAAQPAPGAPHAQMRQAFEKRAAQIAAVPDTALERLNIDIGRALPGITVKLAQIGPLLDRIRTELPNANHELMASAYELAQASTRTSSSCRRRRPSAPTSPP